LGTHYALTPKMDLRFDARHVIVPDRSNNGATSNFEIAAGLTWRFGTSRGGGSGERAPAAVELAAAPTPAPAASPSAAPPSAGPTAPATGPTAAPASKPAPAVVATAPTSAPRAEGPTDADHDGVFTPQDACPQEREDADGHDDGDGCPDPDNDRDGILDGADRCVTDAETVNGYADTDGCPDERHPDLAAVPFARDSSNFTAESAALLDKTFQVLQANPTFRVELGGHSSSDEGSRTLSLRRAEAVKDYLVRRGVAEGRLRVLGYRSEQPASADKSSAGRAKNRRVELKLLALPPAAK
jgi:outer membrane protein OmpA-like peptidoglycan-associated protein